MVVAIGYFYKNNLCCNDIRPMGNPCRCYLVSIKAVSLLSTCIGKVSHYLLEILSEYK